MAACAETWRWRHGTWTTTLWPITASLSISTPSNLSPLLNSQVNIQYSHFLVAAYKNLCAVMYVYMYACACILMYVYVCMCLYTYVCIYRHFLLCKEAASNCVCTALYVPVYVCMYVCNFTSCCAMKRHTIVCTVMYVVDA